MYCQESNSPLEIREVTSPLGVYIIKGCRQGVHYLSLNGVTDENFDPQEQVRNVFQPKEIKSSLASTEQLSPTDLGVIWLKKYFNDPRNVPKAPPLCFPSDSSTSFERSIWTALGAEVGFGKTTTYTGLGALIGNPKASRAVGTAMRKNPVALMVPCHRVILSNGKLGNYAGGKSNKVKEWLLQFEKREL